MNDLDIWGLAWGYIFRGFLAAFCGGMIVGIVFWLAKYSIMQWFYRPRLEQKKMTI
jgi:hypothetical protein